MEKKICKKCGSDLPEDSQGPRCDECKAKRKHRIKTIGIAAGAGALGIVAAILKNTRPENEVNGPRRSDASYADEMGISLSDYQTLNEAIDDGKITMSWANYNVDNIKNGLMSAREVVYSGSPDDDDD